VSDPDLRDGELDLDSAELKARLRTLGMRRSKSAEEARAREIEAIAKMSMEERMLLALRLGRRDRALRGGSGGA
jgi:hypothetical protein